MALKNRKIRRKHRGTRTCGRGKKGSRRKRQGSPESRKFWFIKNEPDHYGKRGMGRKKGKIRYVDLAWINSFAKENDLEEIDLVSLGYERVLGRGNLELPLKIKAKSFTNRAIKKIEEAGGKALRI